MTDNRLDSMNPKLKTLPLSYTTLPPQTLNLEQPPLINTLISILWILFHNESSTHNARSKHTSSNHFFPNYGVVKEKIGAFCPCFLPSNVAVSHIIRTVILYYDQRCFSSVAVLRGFLQISVQTPDFGEVRVSLAEVGEGKSYPLTDERQSTVHGSLWKLHLRRRLKYWIWTSSEKRKLNTVALLGMWRFHPLVSTSEFALDLWNLYLRHRLKEESWCCSRCQDLASVKRDRIWSRQHFSTLLHGSSWTLTSRFQSTKKTSTSPKNQDGIGKQYKKRTLAP